MTAQRQHGRGGSRYARSGFGSVYVVRGGKPVIAPPPLVDGRLRCPACRNAVKPTPSGHLRRHNDLFGYPCYNVATS